MNKLHYFLPALTLLFSVSKLHAQEILNYTDRPGQSFSSYVLSKGQYLATLNWDQMGRTTAQNWDYATFGNGLSADLRYGFSDGVEGMFSFKNINFGEGVTNQYHSVDLGARFQVLEGFEGVNRISLITFLRWYTIKDLWEPERPKLYLGFASLTPLTQDLSLTTNLAAHWLAFNETYSLYYNLNFTYQTSPKTIIYFEHNGNWNNNLNGANFQSFMNLGVNWNLVAGLAVDLRIGYGFSGNRREYFYGPGMSVSNVDR